MKLILKDINKSYKIDRTKKKSVLCDFSYEFHSNNIYLITGESGRGKTTLFNIISLLSPIDSGAMYFESYRLTDFNIDQACFFRKEYVSYSMQFPYFLDHLTVEENLLLSHSQIDMEKLKEYAHFLKIDTIFKKKISHISGGEKQRVDLLSSLLKPSKILLLDEPTSSLDDETAKKLLLLLKKIKKDKIIIISSHNTQLFEKNVDHIIEIDEEYQIKSDLTFSPAIFKAKSDYKNNNLIHIRRINKKSIIITSVFLLLINILISFKTTSYHYLYEDITNYPTLNQFIIKNSSHKEIDCCFNSFPLGNQIMNGIFDYNSYEVDNVSIYMFKDNFAKVIQEGHVYVSHQLAEIIASKEYLSNKEEIIGNEIEVSLYNFQNENITKKFIIQGIIETGNSMINKDVYCLYDDVDEFYDMYNLKSKIKEYEYDVVYVESDDILSEYNTYENMGAYNPAIENIKLTKQILSIFSMCFSIVIGCILFSYLLLCYNEIKETNINNVNYYMKQILIGVDFRDILRNEMKSYLCYYIIILLLNCIILSIIYHFFKLDFKILYFFISLLYILLTNILLLIYNMNCIKRKGVDYLIGK